MTPIIMTSATLTRTSSARPHSFEVIVNLAVADLPPAEREPAQWHQAVGLARQACARIFRDGGKPVDAISAFGLTHGQSEPADWSRAVCVIAESLCAPHLRRAA